MQDHIELDGLRVPAIGLGTWQLASDDAERAVRTALNVGYRHIDTAQLYGNEEAVGRGIAGSDVDRDDVLVTTKVWRSAADRDGVHATTRESLERLGLDHVDLLLLHWPAPDVAPLEETMTGMLEVREQGLTRHIGVSNFPSDQLEQALELAPIVTDQVEHHPYLAVDAVREVLAGRNAFLTAYSPIRQGAVLDDPVITEIAEEHGVTPAQVTLNWLVRDGRTAALPRSRNPERIEQNLDVFGFELSDAEASRIQALDRGDRMIDPPFAPRWDAAA